jgi:hypothetical protein
VGAALVSIAVLTRGGSAPPAPKPAPAPKAPPPAAPQVAAQPPGEGLAIGIGEPNASLLWSSQARPELPDGMGPWRDRLAALRPRYYRLLVDWSRIQPDAAQPPNWTLPETGCLRGRPPCAAFAGIRDTLAAIASQQKTQGGFEVLVSITGVPAWAAAPPSGCERSDATPRSRPINDQGLAAYRALIASLNALATSEGVALLYWSPWNEPNGTFFVSPQRPTCDRSAQPVSPQVYTRLARAMRAELDALPGVQHLVIAELAGLPRPRLRGAGIEEFYAGLPDDVVCAADVFAQHAYAERGRPESARRPVEQLEAVLAARPCTDGKPIWVTETGVGGPDVGGPRTGGLASLRRDCRALDAALRLWDLDPRVAAAFQYTFRDDPVFPVGLADVGLTHTWPAYDEWLAWGGDRPPYGPPPDLPASCAAGADRG